MAKVLVIDDEKIIRERMKKLLELDDYETISAENGQKGLEIFKNEKPDIVLLDIKMPGMDGIEVLKKIKEETTDAQVIIMTGHGGVETATQAIKEGAFGYIQKPVEYDELEIEIKRALEKQEMQRRLDQYVLRLEAANADLEKLFQQLRRDYEIAEKVFEKVVHNDDHRNCPNIKSFQAPMTNVAGDLILIAVGPTGNQSIFLGDFTGHGLSAAIGAIPVAGIFYTMTERGHSVADIVTEINRKLKNVLPTGLFLCACLIELDYKRGTLTLWNGGLPDALIIGAHGGIKRRLPSTHTPLGVVSNDNFDSSVEVVKVAQGERIHVYTDGVIEVVNNEEEMFGQERLDEHFVQNQAPERLFDEIVNSFTTFRGETSQNDDITMVEVRYDIEKLCSLHWKTGSKLGKISKGWKMTLELDPDDLRTDGALDYLIEMLMETRRELRNHKENIYLILSELFTNAMDYGLLGLDPAKKKDPQSFEEYHATREINLSVLKDGWIRIGLEVFKQNSGGERLVVRVEDSGSGFDYNKALPALSENLALGGRGILLVRSLCQELVYEGRGNRVRAVYSCEE